MTFQFLIRPIVWALLSNAALTTAGYAEVPCDRFSQVRTWAVSFDLAGNGKGTTSDGTRYALRQRIAGSLRFRHRPACATPQPVGAPKLAVDVKESIGNVTFARSGQVTDPIESVFTIDYASGTYTLAVIAPVTVKISEDGQVRKVPGFLWGPLHGPDGSPVAGLPIKDHPIPASGTTLSETLQYRTQEGVLVMRPANWEVRWEIVGQLKPPERFSTRRFNNCNEAAALLRQELPGEAKVEVKPQLSSITINKTPRKAYTAATNISFTVDSEKSEIVLPNWTWLEMTSKDRAAMKQVVDALRVHEEGHFTVAEDVLQQFSDRQVSDAAKTPGAARQKLERKLKTLAEKAQVELNNKTAAYDLATEHGAKQSQGPKRGFPGGDDVFLKCP